MKQIFILKTFSELYHTERTHVRHLKVLCRVFFKPILEQKIVGRDFVRVVFANIDEMLEIHTQMFQKMKTACEQWRKEAEYDGLYPRIGVTVASFFSMEDGDRLRNATSTFCQDQQHALRMLAERWIKFAIK